MAYAYALNSQTTVRDIRHVVQPFTEECPVLNETGHTIHVCYEWRDGGCLVLRLGQPFKAQTNAAPEPI